MSATSNNQSTRGWQKHDRGATFCVDHWRVVSECEPNPTLIISDTNQSVTKLTLVPALAAQKIQTGATLPLGESYVRQDDFVAIYPEQSPLTFGFQTYYCVKPPVNDILVIEIWLSVQTSTLESHPQLRLAWDACTEETSATALVESAPGQIQSIDGRHGLIVHPLDIPDCKWTNLSDVATPAAGNPGKPELLVFGGFMEKGVIRRMRLQLVHSHQKLNARQWQDLVEQFANSPLPLTA